MMKYLDCYNEPNEQNYHWNFMEALSTEEKERIINLTYAAVRSGFINGNYLNIENDLKTIMRQHLLPESTENQYKILHDFMLYLHRNVRVPGGRLGIVTLINVGKIKGVPKFLLNCGTAIWGTYFSKKVSPKKLRDLLLS